MQVAPRTPCGNHVRPGHLHDNPSSSGGTGHDFTFCHAHPLKSRPLVKGCHNQTDPLPNFQCCLRPGLGHFQQYLAMPFRFGFGGPTHALRLVERGGDVRSFHVPTAHLDHVVAVVRENIARESRLHTDESKLYQKVGREFSAHESVKHGEYMDRSAVRVADRAAAYRKSGWKAFDPNATPYNADQVQKERSLYMK
jgi:ISXO2-like transposase domain